MVQWTCDTGNHFTPSCCIHWSRENPRRNEGTVLKWLYGNEELWQMHWKGDMEAGESASLPWVWVLHFQNGSPLPMGKQLCRLSQHEVLPSVCGLYHAFISNFVIVSDSIILQFTSGERDSIDYEESLVPILLHRFHHCLRRRSSLRLFHLRADVRANHCNWWQSELCGRPKVIVWQATRFLR